jgi:nicotinamidase-related amidase
MTKQMIGLIVIDYINEIVDPHGKLSRKGYSNFVEKYETLDKVKSLLLLARNAKISIFHVKLCFSSSYVEHPELSPLFGTAKEFGILQSGTWGTEFHPNANPVGNEIIIPKHRISAFYGTALDLILRNQGIKNLLICGVSTDLAVQSAVRDAHDRDYITTVIADCCCAANEEEHEQSLHVLAKISKVVSLSEVTF